MTADLSALIARLEAAEVVTQALEVEFAAFMYANQEAFNGAVNYDPELWSERNASPLSSLDAALALAERVLPGWRWAVQQLGPNYEAILALPNGAFLLSSDTEVYAIGKNPALALCIAILRAKQGEGE